MYECTGQHSNDRKLLVKEKIKKSRALLSCVATVMGKWDRDFYCV